MSSLRPTRLVAALVALVLLLAACSSEPPAVIVSGNDPSTAAKDIATTLDAEGFTIFAALVEHAGMTDLFVQGEGDETLTVFAPSDAAFAELGEGVESVLMGEEGVIVMPAEGEEIAPMATSGDETETGSETGSTDDEATGEATSDDEDAAADAASDDEDAAADATGDDAAGDDAAADDAAADDDAVATPISAVPISEPLSPDETADLLEAIIEYHVAEGTHRASELMEESRLDTLEGTALTLSTREEPPASDDGEPTTVLTVDGIDASATDLIATNGVIHTVDSLLVPEDQAGELQRLIASIPIATDAASTIIGTGDHTQLVAALDAAGLIDEIRELDAVTVFAPTDDAFDALTADQRALLDDPEILSQVLGFHLVEGRAVTQADVLNREQVVTAEGQRVTIAKSGTDYTVDDVAIEREIPATNGVVHVIGELLIPDSVQGPGGF